MEELDFSYDGKLLLSCSTDGSVKLWDPLKGDSRGSRVNESRQWWGLFAPDGRSLLTTGDDGYLVLRERSTLQPRFRFPKLGGAGKCIAISPSTRWLAVSTLDGELCVWDVHSERGLATPVSVPLGKSNAYDVGAE